MDLEHAQSIGLELVAMVSPSGEEVTALTAGAAAALAEPTPFGEVLFVGGAAAYFAGTRLWRLGRYVFKAISAMPPRTVKLVDVPASRVAHAARREQYAGRLEEAGYQLLRRGMMPVRLSGPQASRMLDMLRDAKLFHVQGFLDPAGRVANGRLMGRPDPDTVLTELGAHGDELAHALQPFVDQFIAAVRRELPEFAQGHQPMMVLAKRHGPEVAKYDGYLSEVHIDRGLFVVSAGFSRTASGATRGTLAHAPSTMVSRGGPVDPDKFRRGQQAGEFAAQPDRVVSVMNGNVPHHAPGATDFAGTDTFDRLFVAVVFH